MPYQWPTDTDFAHWELDVIDRDCSVCGRRMYICDHRYRRIHTLEKEKESATNGTRKSISCFSNLG